MRVPPDGYELLQLPSASRSSGPERVLPGQGGTTRSSEWLRRPERCPSNELAVNSSFQAGQAALIEAGLAFLGLGDRNVVSWGAMLSDAQSYLGLAWWTAVFPGLALAALVLAANLVGDGIADAWSVRSSG